MGKENGNGVPTVNTSTWRLPKKAHSRPEGSFTDEMYLKKGLAVPPDPTPTTGGSGLPTVDTNEWVLPSTKQARLDESSGVVPAPAIGAGTEGLSVDDVIEMCGPGHSKPKKPKGKKKGAAIPTAKPQKEAKCPKKSFLKRKKGQDVGPPRAPDDDAVDETRIPQRHNPPERPALQRAHVDIPRLQRLAGLAESEHIEFATGTPHRELPDDSRVELTESVHTRPGLPAEPHGGPVPAEQQQLAGLTESSPHPLPLSDSRRLHAPQAHGVLDDGANDGERFVEQVLAESRWFFSDFEFLGANRPFGEAPGGRSGPWRGSDDEPAETPIVRKGKVKGAVGDPDADTGDEDDEEQPPPKKKAPPPPDEDEGEEDEDEEGDEDEQEEWVEIEEAEDGGGGGSRTGRRLKSIGHHLRAAGRRMRGGHSAQRAKEGLHHHLKKFAKKHGIDWEKRLHPHDKPSKKSVEKAKKKEQERKAKKQPKIKKRLKGLSAPHHPGSFHKPKRPFKPSRHKVAQARKHLAPKPKKKLKKMKRRLREVLDQGLPQLTIAAA